MSELIDRQEFITRYREWSYSEYGHMISDDALAIRVARSLPLVTPKPKTGRWITKIKSDLRGDMWPTNPKCSECGEEPYYSNTIYNYKFCPYCGVKMEVQGMNKAEILNDEKREKWYKMNDGWFDFYVNVKTGEKKKELDDEDILVERPVVDDFARCLKGEADGK